MIAKYYNKKYIDKRDGMLMQVIGYFNKGVQTWYRCSYKRPKGKKIIRWNNVYEGTLTKLQIFLEEIK